MVIIEPSRPQELAWLRVSAYGLSERERAVVDLVVQGASTKEISQTLYISEYTVQEHLSNVFDKVGVRGRRALHKRLFFDQLNPGLTPWTICKTLKTKSANYAGSETSSLGNREPSSSN